MRLRTLLKSKGFSLRQKRAKATMLVLATVQGINNPDIKQYLRFTKNRKRVRAAQ